MSTFLSILKDGYIRQRGPNRGHCPECEEQGACRSWVQAMAADTGVPAEWIAEQVLFGRIDSDWSVSQVEAEYTR